MRKSGSFSEWLRAQTRRDDPIGDLARDVTGDVRSGCLSRITSPEALCRHVAAHDGPPDDAALDAIRSAGAEWRRNGQRPVKAETTSTYAAYKAEIAVREEFSSWLVRLAREGAELTAFELRCLLMVAACGGGDLRKPVRVTANMAYRLAYDLGRRGDHTRLPFDRLVETGWLRRLESKDGVPLYFHEYGRTREDAVWAGTLNRN